LPSLPSFANKNCAVQELAQSFANLSEIPRAVNRG